MLHLGDITKISGATNTMNDNNNNFNLEQKMVTLFSILFSTLDANITKKFCDELSKLKLYIAIQNAIILITVAFMLKNLVD
jgi:hypothetical protein